MNITNDESSLEQYAIISYSHADSDIVKSELKEFDNHSVCYWYDERMTGGEDYEKRFRKMLDKDNCKGIVFFISDTFLLSDPCAKEMEYYKNKYGIEENPDKFRLFILPKGYPYKGEKEIGEKVRQYVKGKGDEKTLEQLMNLKEHIGLFLELNINGRLNYARIGNNNNYIDDYCEDGGLFHKYGIIFGHNRVSNVQFGSFPQKQKEEEDDRVKPREFDKKQAYYAPIEWLVIKDNEQTQTLLSKDLLFAVDYLGLKHPFEGGNKKETNKTLEEQIKDNFMEYFEPKNDKERIKKVRFLSEKELQILLMKSQEDLERKREILLPEATFFAQTSNRKDIPAFWLAGDINDARRVDAATESLSEQKAGTELYYVRVVVDIEKKHPD